MIMRATAALLLGLRMTTTRRYYVKISFACAHPSSVDAKDWSFQSPSFVCREPPDSCVVPPAPQMLPPHVKYT